MSSNPHGNNPFGRPAGNKDGRHVKRGPNNNNPKGRPTKEAIGIKKLEQARKETDRVAKAAAQAVKDNQDLQKRLREIEEKRRKFHEEARTVLASIGADATVDTNLDDDDDDHTNDDDDDDDYDIDGENEVHVNGNGVKAKLTRPSYMPPKGSCLFNQMEEIEKKFASGGLRTYFQASFQMVYDEGNASDHTHKLSKVIQIEKGFDDADPMFMDKLTRHFYHNREWWREHCRMYIPKALDHATRLKRVISIPEKDAYLSTLMTDEVKAYFDSFLAKILRGEFEDQNDVVLFIKNGENSHGLPCYLRLRGTVRTENLHQKMKTSIGPWGVWRTNGTHDVATDMLSFQCEKSNKAMRRL
jgi:hypothetical protein